MNRSTTPPLDIHRACGKLPSLHSMLSQLVAASSISSYDLAYDQSNKTVIDLLAQWSQDIGLETHIQSVAPGKYNLIASIHPVTEHPVTEHKGKVVKGLMLAGHTDTVDVNAEHWHQDPLTLHIIDQHWVGLGVCDMKGFFPLALHAIARTLEKNAQATLQAPITLLATADEETSMAGARALAQHKALHPHHVILGEPTHGRMIYAHKGLVTTRLILSGVRGHASDPAQGANAIEAAHWVMGRLLDWRQEFQNNHNNSLFPIPHPTLNFGCIHGGASANVICDHCEILLDMRLLPNMTATQIQIELQQRLQGLEQAIPHTQVQLKLEEDFPSFAEDISTDFFQLLEKSTAQPPMTANFVTEAPILQNIGHTPIILGPGEIEWAHKPNERLALNTLAPMLQTLATCLDSVFTKN